jgi:hypothetical protein
MPVIDTENGQMDVVSRLLKDRILLLSGVDGKKWLMFWCAVVVPRQRVPERTLRSILTVRWQCEC